jgi:nitrite reductase/ring-hydroxylating ferredoxin subunit
LRVAETSEVPPGESRVFDVSGVPALVANLGGTWVAYRARCAACSASLGPSSALEQTLLTCGACRAAFDLAKAGRPSSGNAHLTPIPLLMMDGAVRIAVPGAAA